MFRRIAGPRRGFTIVELLVAISIIVLLIGILVPTFKAVSTNASNVATAARFSSIAQGAEGYRNERALGGAYPPSRPDRPEANPNLAYVINDPLADNPGDITLAFGANLLVYGLVGVDRLGTPGFRDIGGMSGWFDDLQVTPDSVAPGPMVGLYSLHRSTLEPLYPRYPKVGGGFVDSATLQSISTLGDMLNNGDIDDDPFLDSPGIARQPFFADAWNRPILYYRASKGARNMITDVTDERVRGVFDPRDNYRITGTDGLGSDRGLTFGAPVDGEFNSRIGASKFAEIDPTTADGDVRGNDAFDDSFARFILDKGVTNRNMPVNRDSFLLISAGDDAVYGTADDVTNWDRD